MTPNTHNEYMETVRTWVAANHANDLLARTSHYQWATRWLARYDAQARARRTLCQRRIVAAWLMGLALAAWLWRLL